MLPADLLEQVEHLDCVDERMAEIEEVIRAQAEQPRLDHLACPSAR